VFPPTGPPFPLWALSCQVSFSPPLHLFSLHVGPFRSPMKVRSPYGPSEIASPFFQQFFPRAPLDFVILIRSPFSCQRPDVPPPPPTPLVDVPPPVNVPCDCCLRLSISGAAISFFFCGLAVAEPGRTLRSACHPSLFLPFFPGRTFFLPRRPPLPRRHSLQHKELSFPGVRVDTSVGPLHSYVRAFKSSRLAVCIFAGR